MEITQTQVAMAAVHVRQERLQQYATTTVWQGAPPPVAAGQRPPGPPPADQPGPPSPGGLALDRVSFSQRAMTLAAERAGVGAVAGSDPDMPMTTEELKANLLMRMVELLTGKKMRLVSPRELQAALEEGGGNGEAVPGALQQAVQRERSAGPVGWGMEHHEERIYEEHESTTFAAVGQVHTADGQTIDFELSLTMSRSFVEHSQVDVVAGDARLKDPLVVNFGGNAAQLSGERFQFDLDADGSAETLPGLAAGSGFLALDRDENGTIDNGGELFGPRSGAGFAELAELDSDGNGWIDAADPVYDRLRIWTPGSGEDGQPRLMALGQVGIGAIMTDALETPFRHTDDTNATQGMLRSTSLFLRENGQAGSVQQLDLVV